MINMTKQADIQVLFGASDIKAIYEKALNEKRVDFICLASNYNAVLGNWFENYYAEKLYETVKTREILPDTAENRTYAEKKNLKVNQVRFTKRERSETDVICGADWVAFVSYSPNNPLAVIIEEEELVKAIKAQFNEEWDIAK